VQHALAIGLVNRVVAPKDVVPTAEEFTRKISRAAPVALLKSKAIVRSSGRPLEEARDRVAMHEGKRGDHDAGGPRAFMESGHRASRDG
jgi:enoyl-CoA hydratase/carnithine racemase